MAEEEPQEGIPAVTETDEPVNPCPRDRAEARGPAEPGRPSKEKKGKKPLLTRVWECALQNMLLVCPCLQQPVLCTISLFTITKAI